MTERHRPSMRKHDERDFVYTGKLAWWPAKGHPFRWKPQHGDPECIGEYVSQNVWRHRVIIYIALVLTVFFVFYLFDLRLVTRG